MKGASLHSELRTEACKPAVGEPGHACITICNSHLPHYPDAIPVWHGAPGSCPRILRKATLPNRASKGRNVAWAWSSRGMSFAGMDIIATGTLMEKCCCVKQLKQSGRKVRSSAQLNSFDCALDPHHILHAYLLHVPTGSSGTAQWWYIPMLRRCEREMEVLIRGPHSTCFGRVEYANRCKEHWKGVKGG
eukprot:1141358-Pelagomonas_calceolata.AAC.6